MRKEGKAVTVYCRDWGQEPGGGRHSPRPLFLSAGSLATSVVGRIG